MDLKSLRSWAEQFPNELTNLDNGERLMSHLSSPIADREKVTSSRTFCPLWQFSKVLLLLTCLEFRIGLLKQCWDSWWALRQRIPWCYPGHLSTLKGISDPVGYRFSLWDPNCSRITGKEKWASLGGSIYQVSNAHGSQRQLSPGELRDTQFMLTCC